MVAKRRLLLAIASTMTLVMTAATPMMGATKEAQPGPLRQENLLRIKDMASNGVTKSGAIAAVGWHEASRPGQLYLAFSTNGGRDYRRSNGRLRRYPIVGEPALGMSLAICSNRVWAGTGYHAGSDKAGDSDVFLTSRTIGGGAAQALLTSTSGDRSVRNVTVSCVGGEMIAIGWLQKSGSRSTAHLMLRSLEPLGTVPSFKKVYKLGTAEHKSGIAVASTSGSAAVAFVRDGDLKLKRFDIGDGSAAATVGGHPLKTIAWNDVKYPAMAARGKRLVVAYSDAGKVRAKFSRDLGAKLSVAKTLVATGSIKNPSKAYAVDVVADRIVVEAGTYSKASGKVTPQRLHSKDAGTSWFKQSFGHVGARYGTLIKKRTGAPLLLESWHNNAAKGSLDTLRARYEVP